MKAKQYSPSLTLSTLILFFISVCYGCSSLSGNTPSSSVKNGDKRVAITMDDLPLNIASSVTNKEMAAITNKILSHIKEYNVPVVAFVNEDGLIVNDSLDVERVSILNRWLDAGVELGNHTYSHKSLNKTSASEYKDDIVRGEETIKKLLANHGLKLRYFRHPYLHTGKDIQTRDEIIRFLEGRGQKVAPVTFDNSEWVFAKAYDIAYAANNKAQMDEIAKAYIPYMKSKQHFFEKNTDELFGRRINHIQLIHANRLNSDCLPALLKMMKEDGYSFITLEEALKDSAYLSDDRFIDSCCGISWLHRWALTQGKKGNDKFFKGEPLVPAEILKIAGLEHE